VGIGYDGGMDNVEPFICECVADDALPVLRDVLNVFSDTDSGGNPYLSLDDVHAACIEHGRGPVALILNLLEHLGYVGHYGNLMCSSFLTPAGKALRESLWTASEALEE
jgi:hypothetical protein